MMRVPVVVLLPDSGQGLLPAQDSGIMPGLGSGMWPGLCSGLLPERGLGAKWSKAGAESSYLQLWNLEMTGAPSGAPW